MASPPEDGLFRDVNHCHPCLDDCGRDQSTKVPNSQGRNRQPHDFSQLKETEELLASEMNKLSVQERSKAMDDVHCVGEELQETPAMIKQALIEFENMAQTTADRIYALALNQNRSYVEDPSFRLMFLRANLFNVRKSVNQMMRFLNQKALCFGEAKVAQDIVPADLSREAIALMKTGLLQILKDRDRSDRVILYSSSLDRVPANCTPETLFQAMYHIVFNVLLSMPTVQAQGGVLIFYDESKGDFSKFPGLSFMSKSPYLLQTIPFRGSSVQICLYSSPGSLTIYNKLLRVLVGTESEPYLARTRIHCGSDMERQYQLESLGIPLDNFPVDKDGNIRNKYHEAWCDEHLGNVASSVEQRTRNTGARTASKSTSISEKDVLFGRGRMVQYHAGNVRFRKFLGERAVEYDSLPRHHRMPARIGYTQDLLSSGTRFLKQNEEDSFLWVVCDFDEAVMKVSQFFRTHRRDKRQGAH